VSCTGDLVTVGGSVVVVTPVRSPPGPFSFCVRRSLGNYELSFSALARFPLRYDRVAFYEVVMRDGSRKRDARSPGTYWEGA